MSMVESFLQLGFFAPLVLMVFGVVIFVFCFVFEDMDKPLFIQRVHKLGLGIGVVLILSAATSGLWYEFPTKTGTLITFEGQKIHQNPFGCFQWEDFTYVPDRFSQMNFGRAWSINSTVSPITENPKVRRIHYNVVPEVFDQKKYLSDSGRRGLGKSEANDLFERIIRRCLYDFNEANSIKLSEFYNPLDDEQVERFNSLVEGWVNQKLESEGVKVKAQGFHLPG